MTLVLRYPFFAIRKLNRSSASRLEVTHMSYFSREIDIPKQEGAGQPGLGAQYIESRLFRTSTPLTLRQPHSVFDI